MFKIEIFDTLISTMKYVFQTVPWTIEPYTGNDHKLYDKNSGAIEHLNDRFLKKEIGGWCGLNCEFFKRLIVEKRFFCCSFNYGIEGSLTHITIIVKIGEESYLFDPYFNRYYEIDGIPATFDCLMRVVNQGEYDRIVSIYGEEKKPVQNSDKSWTDMTGEELEQSVIGGHMKKGLSKKMMDLFGNTNPLSLMKIVIPIE